MKRPLVILFVILLLVSGGYWIVERFGFFDDAKISSPGKLVVVDDSFDTNTTTMPEEVPWKVELVASDLYVPWSIVFTSDQRLLVTERNGAVREVKNGVMTNAPLIRFSEVSTQSEEGLMGMVLDPNYASNRSLYVCLAYPKGNELVDKVLKLTDKVTTLEVDSVIIDDIPAAQFHAGCELAFGPDGKLYITTGDATDKQIAQELASLGGKILRINADGTIPEDNPFPGSPVWSYGHRNPQGIAWHPTGALWASEHGPSGFDGARGGDEVNMITKGANYGWPLVSHENTSEGTVSPLLVFTDPSFPPGSVHFYSGKLFPQYTNNLFVAGLRSEAILRVIVSDDGQKVVAYETLPDIAYGRIREIAESPAGEIYFTTSNRDGRGTLRNGDDKIYKIIAD